VASSWGPSRETRFFLFDRRRLTRPAIERPGQVLELEARDWRTGHRVRGPDRQSAERGSQGRSPRQPADVRRPCRGRPSRRSRRRRAGSQPARAPRRRTGRAAAGLLLFLLDQPAVVAVVNWARTRGGEAGRVVRGGFAAGGWHAGENALLGVCEACCSRGRGRQDGPGRADRADRRASFSARGASAWPEPPQPARGGAHFSPTGGEGRVPGVGRSEPGAGGRPTCPRVIHSDRQRGVHPGRGDPVGTSWSSCVCFFVGNRQRSRPVVLGRRGKGYDGWPTGNVREIRFKC